MYKNKFSLKLIAISLSTVALISCSTFGNSSDAPAPMQTQLLVDQVASGTTMNLVAQIPMDIPNSTTPRVANSTIFRVSGNVLGAPNSTVLIPNNSLLYGVYRNDGSKCQISWQALYSDYRSLELHKGYMGIANRISPTTCDPKVGIQTGQMITVTFN